MDIDFILWMLILWPVILCFFCAWVLVMSLPLFVLMYIIKKTVKMLGFSPCDSILYGNVKLFSQTVWKNLQHPQTVSSNIKNLLILMKEKTESDKIEMKEIPVNDKKKMHLKFQRDSTLYFTIMVY